MSSSPDLELYLKGHSGSFSKPVPPKTTKTTSQARHAVGGATPTTAENSHQFRKPHPSRDLTSSLIAPSGAGGLVSENSALLLQTLQSMQRELTEIKSTQKLNTKTWVRCHQMADLLGLHVSTLRKKAQFKLLPEGCVRIRQRGPSQYEYLFHVENVIEALSAGEAY